MHTRFRLVVSTTLATIAAANLLPALGAALGLLSWHEVTGNLSTFNFLFVLPAIPAAVLAAAFHSADPGLRSDPIYLSAFGVMLIGFVAYFLASLAWAPLVRALFPELWPGVPNGTASILFQTLVIAFLSFIPVLVIEILAVRWSVRRAVGA